MINLSRRECYVLYHHIIKGDKNHVDIAKDLKITHGGSRNILNAVVKKITQEKDTEFEPRVHDGVLFRKSNYAKGHKDISRFFKPIK